MTTGLGQLPTVNSEVDPAVSVVRDEMISPASAERSEAPSLKEEILASLPSDGRSMPNAELMAKLGVERAEYWAARELLVEEGSVVRGRGRGGSTALAPLNLAEDVPEVAEVDGASTPRAREDALYEPLKSVLESDWQSDKGHEYLAVENVAKAGSKATGGKWTRPDLVAVEVQVLTYLPMKVLSIHTFEVKPSDMIDITAVYEALAHRRAATHSFVLLHVPDEEIVRVGLEIVIAEARQHGIGVITFTDAADYTTWDEKVVAERVEPSPVALNEFVRVQLSESARNKIEKTVR